MTAFHYDQLFGSVQEIDACTLLPAVTLRDIDTGTVPDVENSPDLSQKPNM